MPLAYLGSTHSPGLDVEFVDAHTDRWNLHPGWKFRLRALDDFNNGLFARFIVRIYTGRCQLRQLTRSAQFHAADLRRELLFLDRWIDHRKNELFAVCRESCNNVQWIRGAPRGFCTDVNPRCAAHHWLR